MTAVVSSGKSLFMSALNTDQCKEPRNSYIYIMETNLNIFLDVMREQSWKDMCEVSFKPKLKNQHLKRKSNSGKFLWKVLL